MFVAGSIKAAVSSRNRSTATKNELAKESSGKAKQTGKAHTSNPDMVNSVNSEHSMDLFSLHSSPRKSNHQKRLEKEHLSLFQGSKPSEDSWNSYDGTAGVSSSEEENKEFASEFAEDGSSNEDLRSKGSRAIESLLGDIEEEDSSVSIVESLLDNTPTLPPVAAKSPLGSGSSGAKDAIPGRSAHSDNKACAVVGAQVMLGAASSHTSPGLELKRGTDRETSSCSASNRIRAPLESLGCGSYLAAKSDGIREVMQLAETNDECVGKGTSCRSPRDQTVPREIRFSSPEGRSPSHDSNAAKLLQAVLLELSVAAEKQHHEGTETNENDAKGSAKFGERVFTELVSAVEHRRKERSILNTRELVPRDTHAARLLQSVLRELSSAVESPVEERKPGVCNASKNDNAKRWLQVVLTEIAGNSGHRGVRLAKPAIITRSVTGASLETSPGKESLDSSVETQKPQLVGQKRSSESVAFASGSATPVSPLDSCCKNPTGKHQTEKSPGLELNTFPVGSRPTAIHSDGLGNCVKARDAFSSAGSTPDPTGCPEAADIGDSGGPPATFRTSSTPRAWERPDGEDETEFTEVSVDNVSILLKETSHRSCQRTAHAPIFRIPEGEPSGLKGSSSDSSAPCAREPLDGENDTQALMVTKENSHRSCQRTTHSNSTTRETEQAFIVKKLSESMMALPVDLLIEVLEERKQRCSFGKPPKDDEDVLEEVEEDVEVEEEVEFIEEEIDEEEEDDYDEDDSGCDGSSYFGSGSGLLCNHASGDDHVSLGSGYSLDAQSSRCESSVTFCDNSEPDWDEEYEETGLAEHDHEKRRRQSNPRLFRRHHSMD